MNLSPVTKIFSPAYLASKAPEMTVKFNMFNSLAGMKPSQQKALIGLTGLASQTAIDLGIASPDPEVRKKCAFRTAAKMVVTTVSGVSARFGMEQLGLKLSGMKALTPTKEIVRYSKGLMEELTQVELNKIAKKAGETIVKGCASDVPKIARVKYAEALGAMAGIVGAITTVFAADMVFIDPLMNRTMAWYDKKFGKKSDGRNES